MVGSVNITQTREFNFGPASLSPKVLDEDESAAEEVQCSWCNKPQSQVKRLISQNKIHVCNECIGLCVDVLSAEFGKDWSKS